MQHAIDPGLVIFMIMIDGVKLAKFPDHFLPSFFGLPLSLEHSTS